MPKNMIFYSILISEESANTHPFCYAVTLGAMPLGVVHSLRECTLEYKVTTLNVKRQATAADADKQNAQCVPKQSTNAMQMTLFE